MKTGALIAIVSLLSTAASAQSLADVAKRAEEQRAKAAAEHKPPAKVITNGDLKPAPPVTAVPPAPVAATPDAEEKPAAGNDATKDVDPKKTEAYWKRRATELHAQLAADEKAAVPGRDQMARMQHNIDAIACFICPARNQLESQLIQMQEEQKRLDAAVAADRAAISEFEEEGRRLGILPGWLRPR
jgi:hypothetical protein